MNTLNRSINSKNILTLSLLILGLAFTGCMTDDKDDEASGPTLSVEPSDQIVVAGTTASFSVIASGSGSMTFQWMRNDVNIEGATSATYSFAASVSDDGAAYKVKVTDSKGSTTSHQAFLRILVNSKQITLGAQNSFSQALFLDLDTWNSYTASQGSAHANEIDLVFAYDTSATNDSAALYSPQYAKNLAGSQFSFMQSWSSSNSIEMKVVSVADWNNVKTATDIKALYDAGTSATPAGRVTVTAGKTVVVKSNSDLYVLLRIDGITQSLTGTVNITGKAKSL